MRRPPIPIKGCYRVMRSLAQHRTGLRQTRVERCSGLMLRLFIMPNAGIVNLTQYGDRSSDFHLSSGREIGRECWLGQAPRERMLCRFVS